MLAYYLVALFLLPWQVRGSPFFGDFQGGRAGSGDVPNTEYYNILGVEKNANPDQIKQAYRKKAMYTHPDKGGSEEEFKKLNEAYEVLSDQNKRSNYDRYGNATPGQSRGFNDMGAFADMFRNFESGFGSGFFSRPLLAQVEITLEDLFKGKKISVAITREHTVECNILPGMQHGQQTMLRGEVTDSRGVPRDLIIQILEVKHPVYTRKNADLLIQLPISLREAILGFEKPIQYLDGSIVWIRSRKDRVSRNEDVLIIEGLGMPILHTSSRGKLFVKTVIEMPTSMWLSESELELLDSLLPKDEGEGSDLLKPRKGDKVLQPSLYSDLSEFGQSGNAEEEEDSSNPFASFFFR
jgi:DnaJ-class molecular chaperone